MCGPSRSLCVPLCVRKLHDLVCGVVHVCGYVCMYTHEAESGGVQLNAQVSVQRRSVLLHGPGVLVPAPGLREGEASDSRATGIEG